MKCRICKTEIGEQIYCPMCGAPVKPQQETEEEQPEQTEAGYSWQYQGIDADATTVLSLNNVVNEKEEEENNGENRCVVSEEIVMPRKGHKRLIFVIGITAVILLMTGIVIFWLFSLHISQ